MTPPKSPKQPTGITQARVNELYAKNLEEQRRWFARQSAGHEHGHNVMAEHIISYISEAWRLAAEGKTWSAP